jgi:hypothetical protein
MCVCGFWLLEERRGFWRNGRIAWPSGSGVLDTTFKVVYNYLYTFRSSFQDPHLQLGRLGGNAVFMCVTALSDVLTLNFFWLVRDEGSWLEIRTGVSPFRIGGALGVFLAASEGLGGW